MNESERQLVEAFKEIAEVARAAVSHSKYPGNGFGEKQRPNNVAQEGNRPKYENQEQDEDERGLLALIPEEELARVTEPHIHLLGKGVICTTDHRARKRSPFEIVVEATEGFIPLWAEGMVLRWRFNTASLSVFQQPESVKSRIRALLNEAIMAWGDAVPIRFTEHSDNYDFEIVVEQHESCTPQGCTLARAFFPDEGRHQLFIFPTMFEQSNKEQVDTMSHEIGHIFGLRHFFAPESETRWPSEIFGEHKPFSIMNYGDDSELTLADRRDLKLLYEGARNGQLKQINGTPIKLFRPYHYLLA
ncbi:matrix metalloproteinase-11 [Nostoc sp. 3335mG]|nr:matrix metalloproteinase-11 [Nostoc sp. 3335mG]